MNTKTPRIAMIAAMANDRVIGRDNDMPWHLPADLAHFKQITMGKPVIMGRKTYESIGRPLPGRLNIVLTRDAAWQAEGVSVVQTPEQAFELAQQEQVEEVIVMGGGQIYDMLLPKASRLYLTHIDLVIDGDTCFPDYLAQGEWQETEREVRAKDERNAHDLVFVTLERVAD